MERFKVGDKVAVRQTQLTGASKRSPVYLFGEIVSGEGRPVFCGRGFYYVQLGNTVTVTHRNRMSKILPDTAAP
jgi:hypothetical protein